MRFLSLFSGIEAASVAFAPLGWTAAAFCEIDPFASAVLKHHYPDTPNLGDVETANVDAIGVVDLIIFGSPCQSFSVAGRRLGLDDPRGNMALIGGQVVYRKRPRWFIFENVPGLLSLDSGWDFGTLVAAFAGYPPGSVFKPPADGWSNSGIIRQAGTDTYGIAWRVLDAQYVRVDGLERAVPQRRRRLFVVGYLGDWRRAAAVLFEPESLRGNHPPRRQAGQGIAPTIAGGAHGGGPNGRDVDTADSLIAPTIDARPGGGGGGWGTDFLADGGLVTAPSLTNSGRGVQRIGEPRGQDPLIVSSVTAKWAKRSGGPVGDECQNLVADPIQANEAKTYSLAGNNPRPRNLVAFSVKDHGGDALEDCSPTLRAGGFDQSHANAGVMPAVAFSENQRSEVIASDTVRSLSSGGGKPGQGYPAVAFKPSHFTRDKDGAPSEICPPLTKETDKGDQDPLVSTASAVRRLMPIECERLQGLPDNYTLVRYRGKPAADGPRYKVLGNSFAVNCVRWIGQRIESLEKANLG